MVVNEKVIAEFEKWCNEMDENCPVVCLDALNALKGDIDAVKLTKEQEQALFELKEEIKRSNMNGHMMMTISRPCGGILLYLIQTQLGQIRKQSKRITDLNHELEGLFEVLAKYENYDS